eukprot:TRINITY_DN93981_c0_g1_i1.p1 TRINITY_DN93981_c0_g1~~TRINITY_DN93981_c0_g1_i1.p1  ORF type:complete len:593 (-),score=72.09 TRINITY_DN93981_c0_g1_i1:61-1839(-)
MAFRVSSKPAVAMIDATAAACSQFYHSEDNIADLKIRVRLSPRRFPGQPLPPPPEVPGAACPPGGETENFDWRERVLGIHESEAASYLASTGTKSRQGRRLFARFYESGSRQVEREEEVPSVEDDPASGTCFSIALCRRFSSCVCCRRRSSRGAEFLAKTALEDQGALACDRLRLFALLDPPEDADEGELLEVMLCELRASRNGRALEARPPLCTRGREDLPYRIKLPGGAWHEYSVENVSHVPTDTERAMAAKAQEGFDSIAPELRRSLAGAGFEPVGREALGRYSYIGEVVAYDPFGDARCVQSTAAGAQDGLEAAAMFRHSRPPSWLSVLSRAYYYLLCEVSLPARGQWEVAEPFVVEDRVPKPSLSTPWSLTPPICTQYASISGCHDLHQQCVFNHPVELHLDQRQNQAVEVSDLMPPRLVFTLMSVDRWERHCLQGYAFVDLPQSQGQHELRAHLWAPLGSLSQQLTAKLCGAFLPLASPHLVASSDMHERDTLPRNRSSLRAKSSLGCLHIRLQVLKRSPTESWQSERPARRPGGGRESLLGNSSPERAGLRQRRAERAARNLRWTGEPSPSPEARNAAGIASLLD